jgi:hypothetical protein
LERRGVAHFLFPLLATARKKENKKPNAEGLKQTKEKEELLTWILLGLRYELFF